MNLTQVLQSFVVPEENLSESQVLMLDSLGKSVQEGQVINLTEEEIQQYTQFKRKLELFESNLSEDTFININEGILKYLGGAIADGFTGRYIREMNKITDPKTALKGVDILETEAIRFTKEVWPDDKKEPTGVYLEGTTGWAMNLFDASWVKDVMTAIKAGETYPVQLLSVNFSARKRFNEKVAKDRDTLIKAIKDASNITRDAIKLHIKHNGDDANSIKTTSAIKKFISCYSAFLQFARNQARMAA